MNERRAKLMAARDVAVKNRDWALMNELTRKLAKLPVPTTREYANRFGGPNYDRNSTPDGSVKKNG